MCEMSKCGNGGQPHVLDGAGHDGDGDEAEYDDEDEEPCPQHLCDPTHTQGEGGGHVCLTRVGARASHGSKIKD